MIDKQQVKRRFSKQAKTYDAFANVQKRMADQLIEKLKPNKEIHSILEIGCGTGHMTQLLLDRFPEACITAVDIADGMIDYARERFCHIRRIDFLCADIETFETHQQFDLIISNAAFQWLNEPFNTTQRLTGLLKREGQFIFSTFGKRTFHELHESHKHATEQLDIHHEPLGPKFQDACDWQEFSKRTSMQAHLHREELVEYFPSAREFLHSVKKIGANSSSGSDGAPPALMRRLLQVYDKRYNHNKGVPATYEALYAVLQFE